MTAPTQPRKSPLIANLDKQIDQLRAASVMELRDGAQDVMMAMRNVVVDLDRRLSEFEAIIDRALQAPPKL